MFRTILPQFLSSSSLKGAFPDSKWYSSDTKKRKDGPAHSASVEKSTTRKSSLPEAVQEVAQPPRRPSGPSPVGTSSLPKAVAALPLVGSDDLPHKDRKCKVVPDVDMFWTQQIEKTPLDSGNFNTVSLWRRKGRNGTTYEAVFKPLCSAKHISDFPKYPYPEIRNVAAYAVDQLLGFNVIVRSKLAAGGGAAHGACGGHDGRRHTRRRDTGC